MYASRGMNVYIVMLRKSYQKTIIKSNQLLVCQLHVCDFYFLQFLMSPHKVNLDCPIFWQTRI